MSAQTWGQFGLGSSEDINQGLLIHQRATSHAHHAQMPQQPPQTLAQKVWPRVSRAEQELSTALTIRLKVSEVWSCSELQSQPEEGVPGTPVGAEWAGAWVLGSITAMTHLDKSARFSVQTVTPVR